MNSYQAPFGYAPTPFSGGGPFPGAPPFGTPSAPGQMRSPGFSMTNGPDITAADITDFAQGVFRPNRVTDQTTNGQIVYHYHLLPSADDGNRLADIGVSMLCISRRVFNMPKNNGWVRNPKRLRITGHVRPEISIEAFEVTHLNYWLWQDATKVPNDQEYSSAKTKVGDIVRDFSLIGVVLNEPASNGPSDRGIRGENRVVNFVTSGRCPTFNIWEPHTGANRRMSGALTIGSGLWLLVKRVAMSRNADTQYPWQFVPFVTDRGKKPKLEDLKFNFTEAKHYDGIGHAIYVGTVGHVVGDVALRADLRLSDQPFYHSLARPIAEIFLQI